MLLLILCLILILLSIIPLIIFIKNKQYKFLALSIITIVLFVIFLVSIKVIMPLIPHNDVSKEDRVLLEKYISDNYGLELKVKKSEISHRGNIGINPGIEYIFVLENSNGFEYHLNIDELYEVDLKTILSRNPELSLIQMK